MEIALPTSYGIALILISLSLIGLCFSCAVCASCLALPDQINPNIWRLLIGLFNTSAVDPDASLPLLEIPRPITSNPLYSSIQN